MTNRRNNLAGKIIVTVACSMIILGILLIGIRNMTLVKDNAAMENLENAIVQASVHCYAVEGCYPESLDYLKEHYGIAYDEEKYVVKYEVIAKNLRPQIHVIRMEEP